MASVDASVDAAALAKLSHEELIARVVALQTELNQHSGDRSSTGQCEGTSRDTECASAEPGVPKRTKKGKQKREFDFTRHNVRHVALQIAYLGWRYQGLASQDNVDNTVETQLFKALVKLCLVKDRPSSHYSRCGRTDAGVSAFRQVVALRVRSNLQTGDGVFPFGQEPSGESVPSHSATTEHEPMDDGAPCRHGNGNVEEFNYPALLNRVLPPDIKVLAWAPVDLEFSARFSCRSRTYWYLFPRSDLDIDRLRDGARRLVGHHDYRNLCKMDLAGGVTNFQRSIESFLVEPLSGGSSDDPFSLYAMKIRGKGFLWHQVRCMVGVLLLVGQRLENPEIVDHLLDVVACPAKPQYTMANEIPLILYDCEFDADRVCWRRHGSSHATTFRHFQELWADHAVRAASVHTLLNLMDEQSVDDSTPWRDHADRLACMNQEAIIVHHHNKRMPYRPLLSRPFSETLETRLKKLSTKKRKAEQNESASA